MEQGHATVDGEDRVGDTGTIRGDHQPTLDRARGDRLAAAIAGAGGPVVDRVGGDDEAGAAGVADVRPQRLAMAATHVVGEVVRQGEHTLGTAVSESGSLRGSRGARRSSGPDGESVR